MWFLAGILLPPKWLADEGWKPRFGDDDESVDFPDGWRLVPGSGGVPANAVLVVNVATDFSMPLSPCFRQGMLWFCKSATGAFSALRLARR